MGIFPSVSGAWVLSEEKFMEDIKWIDQLKLRAAIGLAGNNRISDDMWRYLYTVNSTGGPGFGEATQFESNGMVIKGVLLLPIKILNGKPH